MNPIFYVHVRIGKETGKPMVEWMKPNKNYPVLDIYKHKPHPEKGLETWFLIPNLDNDNSLMWVSSVAVTFSS